MPSVLITTSSFGTVSPEPIDRLRAAGFSFRLNPLRIEGMKRTLIGCGAGIPRLLEQMPRARSAQEMTVPRGTPC
jgi:hypothetical protein